MFVPFIAGNSIQVGFTQKTVASASRDSGNITARMCSRPTHGSLRIESRFDKLPFEWLYWMGPCFEQEQASKGILVQNRRSRASMTDIEDFHKEHPTATLFDSELFYLGWKAGAKWAESNFCTEEKEEKACNPPDCKSIAEPHKGER